MKNRFGQGKWVTRAATLLLLIYVGVLQMPNVAMVRAGADLGVLAWGLMASAVWFAAFGLRLDLGVVLSVPLAGLLFAPEMLLINLTGRGIGAAAVGMFFEADAREFVEYFSVYKWQAILIVAWLALSFALALFLRRVRLEWRGRARQFTLFSILVFSVVLMGVFWRLDAAVRIDATAQDVFSQEPKNYLLGVSSQSFPMDIYVAAHEYWSDVKKRRELRGALSGFAFDYSRSSIKPAEAIVVVIGESARADRWGLAGYYRQTTPYLSKLANIVYLPDVVSTSVATRVSVPRLVSRSSIVDANSQKSGAVEPSFLALFKELGYATFWVSNQSPAGFFDTSSAFYAYDAQHVLFRNYAGGTGKASFDGDLLRDVEVALKKPGKVAVVVHMLGSHFDYANRYPEDFNIYQPSAGYGSRSSVFSPLSKEALGNAYDNSIVYSDYVLASIVRLVNKNKPSGVVIYASDHGEDLFDADCGYKEVSRVGQGAYRVPAFVWFGDEFFNHNGEYVDLVRQRSIVPLTNRFVFSAAVDVAGVVLGGTASHGDFFTRTPSTSARVVDGVGAMKVDFDKAVRENSCHIGQHAR